MRPRFLEEPYAGCGGGGGGGSVVALSCSVLGHSESFQSDSSQKAIGGQAEGQLRPLARGRLVSPKLPWGSAQWGAPSSKEAPGQVASPFASALGRQRFALSSCVTSFYAAPRLQVPGRGCTGPRSRWLLLGAGLGAIPVHRQRSASLSGSLLVWGWMAFCRCGDERPGGNTTAQMDPSVGF